jgi:uncharacterized protein (DUF433 family)
MADSAEIYNAGLDYPDATEWLSDAAADIRVLLLKSSGPPTFDATHATVADVLAHANNAECDDGSYARVTVADTGRNINAATRESQLRFDAAVDFGSLTGETVGAALVYAHDTDDDSSIPLVLVIYDPAKVSNGAGFTVGTTNSVVISRTGATNP